MRRGLILPLAMVTVAGACHSSGETMGTGGHASATGSSSAGGGSAMGGSSTSSSTGTGGGGPVPLPALDADGCPGLAPVGAESGTLTPIPAGITTTYYVSAAGDDTNAGTDKAKPIQTLARVQALLDAGTIAGGTAVLFRAGDVFHGHLALAAKNTGTAAAPVVLGAFGSGAAPTLVGTQVIPASSFVQNGGRWVAPVTGTPARLFFGPDEVFQARFPNAAANESDAVVRATSGSQSTVVLDAASVQGLPLQGAYAWVRTVSWRRDRMHVDSAVTSSGKITLTVSRTEIEPGGPPHAATGLSVPAAAGTGVYFEGLLPYLDTDGEWAVDSGMLYLRPPGGASITAQPVEVSVPGPVIGATGVTNLVVQDLHLDRGEGAGIQASVNGAGPTVTNTLITAPYYAGIGVTGAPSPTLVGNTVTGSRNSGILVSGAAGALIAHNEIASGGQGQHATYGVGIQDINSTGGGVIDHNFVHDMGQAGIELGGSKDETVHRNVLVRAPSYFGDAGAVYWNFDGGGNVVELNVLCKTSANVDDAVSTAVFETNGFYLDDDVRPAVIRQNTILRADSCGLHIVSQGTDVDTAGGAQVPSHTIDDNVFVGSGHAAGKGQEGGQLCYVHDHEKTGGKNDPTLGQLRSVKGNVFIVLEPWQRAYSLKSYEASHDYGALDGNQFALPLAQGIVQDQSPSTPAGLYSLNGWRTVSGGKDANSTAGAPQRTRCDLASIDGANVVPAAQAWLGAPETGPMGIHLPAPSGGQTQAWIENATPLPVTAGSHYLVELFTTSATPQRYSVNLTNATTAPDGAASVNSLVSDATSAREAFVVTATTGGMQIQIVAGAALTLDQIRVRPVTTGDCALSLGDRVRVVTNTTDVTQTYAVGSGWLDLTGAPIADTVTVDPFRSVVLQKQATAF